MAISQEDMDVLRDKFNAHDDAWTSRLTDVANSITPRLNSLLAYDSSHVFTSADEDWWLFENACLYEFSDAWDDFVNNYEREIQSVRLQRMAENAEA